MLSDLQQEQFIQRGYVRLENAFPFAVADYAREILWRATGCDPTDKTTWTKPVVRLGDFRQEPFHQAANTPALHDAFDALAGVGRWVPRESLGAFVVRFPHTDDPGVTGWHIDASLPARDAADSYFNWRINLRSDGRALLMLSSFPMSLREMLQPACGRALI